jgi:hypothetical protein
MASIDPTDLFGRVQAILKGYTGTGFDWLQIDPVTKALKVAGTVTVDTSSLATGAKQDTGNNSLSSIDGKLLATAVSADAVANPTVSKIGTFLSGFNGTTWDRLRTGTSAISATLTGFLNTLPWSIYQLTPGTRTDGQGGPFLSDATGSLKVTNSQGFTDLQLIATFSDTSPASATTVASASTATGLCLYENLIWLCDVQGGTGGTLNIYVQDSCDGGSTWYDRIALPQLSAGAAVTYYRLHGALTGVISTVGKNLVPTLTAGTISGGYWGNQARVVYKAGSGTSGGTAQVIRLYGSRLKG